MPGKPGDGYSYPRIWPGFPGRLQRMLAGATPTAPPSPARTDPDAFSWMWRGTSRRKRVSELLLNRGMVNPDLKEKRPSTRLDPSSYFLLISMISAPTRESESLSSACQPEGPATPATCL